MVWVSNNSSVGITVQITNNTAGNPNVFNIVDRTIENYANNHWYRTGQETATIKYLTGKSFTLTVQKDDKVEVYDDAYLVIPNVACTKL